MRDCNISDIKQGVILNTGSNKTVEIYCIMGGEVAYCPSDDGIRRICETYKLVNYINEREDGIQ